MIDLCLYILVAAMYACLGIATFTLIRADESTWLTTARDITLAVLWPLTLLAVLADLFIRGMPVVLLLYCCAAALGADRRDIVLPSGIPHNARTIALGERVFNSPLMSPPRAGIACATCHEPQHAYSQTTDVSTGINGLKGVRKSPPLLNVGFAKPGEQNLFWDSHSATLQRQCLDPMLNPVECGNKTTTEVAARFDADSYFHQEFVKAYGIGCTVPTLAAAIASFEYTLVVTETPISRYRDGQHAALTERQKRGLAIFDANCARCHSGPDFTDRLPHNVGVSVRTNKGTIDRGAGEVFGSAFDFRFKTPTLLSVESHPPYGHNGTIPTLDAMLTLHENPPQGAERGCARLDADDHAAVLDLLEHGFRPTRPTVAIKPAMPK